MMMNSPGGKQKVDSLILISVIFLQLMAFSNMFAVAAPPAASSPVTTSSSTSTSNGILHPPSKIPAGSSSFDSNKNDASQSNFGIELSSSPENQLVSAATLRNNEIAHQIQRGGNTAASSSLHQETVVAHNGAGELSKVANGQRVSSFVDFPPYTKPMSSQPRYQRQRRSYPIPNSLMSQDLPSSGPSYRFTRPDELELRLDNDREREAFLKLMTILASENGNSNRGIGLNDDLSSILLRSQDDDDNDDGDDEIDLGTFQRSPYWNPESINLMSSLLAAESPRTSSPHGLPVDNGLASRGTRDDDNNDGEWMEDALPIRGSHFKTRRSGNTEFTYNPVKSHFRRYMRAVPLKSGRGLEFIPNGGRFGPIIINRRRRATSMVGSTAPAMNWM